MRPPERCGSAPWQIREHIPSLQEIHAGSNFTPNVDKDLEFDALQMHLASELIARVKQRHPDARLGVSLLFRGYLMRALDRLLPKDAWIANMENCGNAGLQMDYYGGIAGRDLIVTRASSTTAASCTCR